MSSKENRTALYLFGMVIAAFLIGRIFGSSIFDNNWSFDHWHHLPIWYPVAWAVTFALFASVLYRYGESIGSFFNRKGSVIGGVVVLLGFMVLFGFDSVLYGSGNIRMAQIAQADQIVFRWFEIGSIWLMSILNYISTAIVENPNHAANYAWRVYAYASTLLSILAALWLAKRLTTDAFNRLTYFLIFFFGPQSLVYFGLVGAETMVVPVCLWFACFAFDSIERRSGRSLAALWGVTVIGTVIHISLAALLPAALFVSIHHLTRKDNSVLPLILSLITYGLLMAMVFKWGNSSLEYRTFFLFPEGRLPHNDYGLFSLRHIGDILQLMFLAGPVVMAIKWSSLGKIRDVFFDPLVLTSWLMCLGTMSYLFISDPRQSIVLDFPRLVVYFAPASFFGIAMLHAGKTSLARVRGYLPLLAAASVFIPLSYLPSYTNIEMSESYVDGYMVKHDNYYHDGCLAYRDSYFIRGEYKIADKWERRLIIRSDDYLNLRGTGDLAHGEQYSDAIRVLYQMIALNPYWASPRAQLVAIQLEMGRFGLAKPQIDTALMLEPYNRIHLVHQYVYYRSVKNLTRALSAIEHALEYFPNDLEIRSDQMLIEYGLARYPRADSLAKKLYLVSDTLPFPYLVRGLIANRSGSHQTAISNFEKFIELAPNEPEAEMIKHRMDSLKMLLNTE